MSGTPWLDRLRAELAEPDLTDTQLHYRALAYVSARSTLPQATCEAHDRRALLALGPVRYLRLRKILKAYAERWNPVR